MTHSPDKRSDKAAVFARRMNKVLDHIDTHLAGDLHLEQLAALAAFSPFHFHRVFRAWTGDTLQDFVRHRRLEAAGGQLRHNRNTSITEIAMACGFASGESFTRAFGQHFGMTPTAWRRGGYEAWEARQRPDHVRAGIGYDGIITLRHCPEVPVVYSRFRGEYRRIVSDGWAHFGPWVASLGLQNPIGYGMGIDDPTITPPTRCRYDVCVEMPANAILPAQRLSTKVIASGLYACLNFKGSRRDLNTAWHQLLAVWLPESGFSIGETPFVEAYTPTEAGYAGADVEAELRMPVVT